VIVWAHNSHSGDARHTDMGQSRGVLNIGQLAREHSHATFVALTFQPFGALVLLLSLAFD